MILGHTALMMRRVVTMMVVEMFDSDGDKGDDDNGDDDDGAMSATTVMAMFMVDRFDSDVKITRWRYEIKTRVLGVNNDYKRVITINDGWGVFGRGLYGAILMPCR